MGRNRIVRFVALAAFLIGTVAAPPARAVLSTPSLDTWAGQVVSHHRHFDYQGSSCPKGTEACIMVVATFRIVPLTPEAARALRRVAGGPAELVGYRTPPTDRHHDGTLFVSRVVRS